MIRNIFLLFLPLIVQAQVLPLEKMDFRKADSLEKLYKGEKGKNLSLLAYQLTTTPLHTTNILLNLTSILFLNQKPQPIYSFALSDQLIK